MLPASIYSTPGLPQARSASGRIPSTSTRIAFFIFSPPAFFVDFRAYYTASGADLQVSPADSANSAIDRCAGLCYSSYICAGKTAANFLAPNNRLAGVSFTVLYIRASERPPEDAAVPILRTEMERSYD